LNTEFKDIDKRYDLFWLGMKYEKENNFQQAIETYLLYSEALAFADRYIPHIWISVLYDKLNLPSKAIYHIEQHVKGYIEWKASIDNKDLSKSKIGELYKDIGKRYLVINELENAIHAFELALSYDENVSVKKLIDSAKNKVNGKS
jgi:tetratricopeptide (TPR) repeat protein